MEYDSLWRYSLDWKNPGCVEETLDIPMRTYMQVHVADTSRHVLDDAFAR